MELKEGLEFYKKCLTDCDRVIADLLTRADLEENHKQALIDRQLEIRTRLKKTIEVIEELLR